MNSQFLVWFMVLMAYHLFLNLKHWARQPKATARLYTFITLVTLGLFLCVASGYQPPMPTRFFIERVSPWVFSIIHPQ
ncbi:hypothetical protein QJ48_21410 [Paenibacillus sp. A3]|uniref:hypothetical protein n=1 Tax=Paenibacillus sp. A3 TaxID=1337054 RepID=UPI0006D53395|nr:hypothetical protein [Paenibacillus sp. A3]KPV57522.1 hypothetical protein QJ48_21410 [Paenibacillus sp. A3]